MQNQEKIVKLNCLLTGDVANKFLAIKEEKGLENKTEVIRLIVSETYKNLTKAKEAQ